MRFNHRRTVASGDGALGLDLCARTSDDRSTLQFRRSGFRHWTPRPRARKGEGVRMVADREVSMGLVVAYGLWTAAMMLIGFGWWLESTHLGRLGVVVSVAAGTATIRQYFVTQNVLMRNAYELGRDSVTPMRR